MLVLPPPSLPQTNTTTEALDGATPAVGVFPVLVSNTLATTRVEIVNITVAGPSTVTDASMKPVASQQDGSTLYFLATVPPLGYTTYYVNTSAGDWHTAPNAARAVDIDPKSSTFVVENSVMQLLFDSTSGALLSVKNVGSGVAMDLRLDMMAYVNGTGGAYILAEDFEAVPLTPTSSFVATSGPLFTVVCRAYESDVSAAVA